VRRCSTATTPNAGQSADRSSIGPWPAPRSSVGFHRRWASHPGRATRRAGRRRDAVQEALDANDYHFHAHGIELGQRYTSAAVLHDGTPPAPYTRDPELYYHPTTRPGAYLPHAWLQQGERQISTLDVAGSGRFTLVTGIGGEGWLEAAEKVAAETGVPIAGAAVGHGLAYDDVYGDWAALREIDDDGALLIRPDRHIAWRHHTAGDDPVAALRDAVTRVLALGPTDVPEGENQP
jgi:2,4-dichlorophenol 6-monooxygenase